MNCSKRIPFNGKLRKNGGVFKYGTKNVLL